MEDAIAYIEHITRSPTMVFVLSLVAMALAAWLGAVVGRSRRLETETREQFAVVRTATLTLLGLIIGFSFSMALIRYDQRKNFEEAEANAIGTEYLRADLLPAADATIVRKLLRSYLDQRIAFYSTRDEEQLREIDAQTTRSQSELWSAVRIPALAQPSPVAALAVAGMNDVFNTRSNTLAAWFNRIPVGAWSLMLAIALCANGLIGLGARLAKADFAVMLVLPVVVAIAFFLIADTDAPRGGSIRVNPQNLLNLARSLPAA